MNYKQIGKQYFTKAVSLITPLALFTNSVFAEKPNIIFIMTDQQTADAMSNRGNPYVHTPAMDELASEGVVFPNSYCSYPLSGPSRASIMTGKMPVELCVLDNDYLLSKTDSLQSIGITMRDAGYTALYAGKWHIPTIDIPENEFGFEKIAGMYDPDMALHIDNRLSEGVEGPLFLVASYLNPHEICEYARSQSLHYGKVEIPEDAVLPPLPANFSATEGMSELVEIHKNMSPKLYPTNKYTKRDWQEYLYGYYRLVERVDKHIADLINVLKKHNLYENSVIIFTSDHGDGVAAHRWNQKRALFEETINVPLIVKPPKTTQESFGYTIDGLVNIGIDIFPTICDYGNAPVPEDLNGISLKGVIEKRIVPHESLVVETHFDGINARSWCIIKENYKYVFYRFFKDREHLYDLSNDKGETNNLIFNDKYIDVYSDLKRELHEYAIRVNDVQLLKDLKHL